VREMPIRHEHGPYSTAVIKFRWNTSRMGEVTAHQDADIKPTNKTHRSWRKCFNPPTKWDSFRMLGYVPLPSEGWRYRDIKVGRAQKLYIRRKRRDGSLCLCISILHNYVPDAKLSVPCEVNHNRLKAVESDKLIRHSIGTE
jgi:hypothetical protein